MATFILSLLASLAAGYVAARYFCGKNTGAPGRVPSIKIPVMDRVVHIHHWLYSSFAVIAFRGTWQNHLYVLYFLFGMIIQGLTYEDFHKIVYKKEPQSRTNL